MIALAAVTLLLISGCVFGIIALTASGPEDLGSVESRETLTRWKLEDAARGRR